MLLEEFQSQCDTAVVSEAPEAKDIPTAITTQRSKRAELWSNSLSRMLARRSERPRASTPERSCA